MAKLGLCKPVFTRGDVTVTPSVVGYFSDRQFVSTNLAVGLNDAFGVISGLNSFFGESSLWPTVKFFVTSKFRVNPEPDDPQHVQEYLSYMRTIFPNTELDTFPTPTETGSDGAGAVYTMSLDGKQLPSNWGALVGEPVIDIATYNEYFNSGASPFSVGASYSAYDITNKYGNCRFTMNVFPESAFVENKLVVNGQVDYYLIRIDIDKTATEISAVKKTATATFLAPFIGPSYNYVEAPTDPFEPEPPSGPGDLPPGSFDGASDVIADSSLPSLSAANTGFTRIYNPTLAQVQDLARYLWTDENVIQTIWNHIKQYFEDPMQAIIGFNLVPCAVPDAGSQSFALMYIDTGVQMNVAANQFVDVDCGSVKLDRYYGSALDQSPYTRVSCFLPFIGTVKLNTDEVMGTTLQVKYRIDICSGSCVAKIAVDGNIIYQYSGHCAINIPISSADFSSYVQATMSIAKLAVGAAVGGAMGAMAATSTEPSQQTNRAVTTTRTETSTERNPATGRQVTAGTSTVTTREETHSETSTKASFDYLTPSNIANTVGQVMSSKPIVEHTGSFSGNSGYLGIRRPFLIIERPNMCLPDKYQQFNGYPSMITMKLGDCKGYTRLQQVQLTGMTATNPEQAELMGLLKSGVIF